MRRAVVIVVFGALASCGSPLPGDADGGATDAGRRTDRGSADAGPSLSGDQDGDGVCDATEAMVGTSATLGDTDNDGLTDLFELRAGSDPLNASDPGNIDRVTVFETPMQTVFTDYPVSVDGTGGVLEALWQDRGDGLDGRPASAWAAFELTAVAADPAGVVQEISGARFVGVLGRTQLNWRLTTTSRGGAANGDGGVAQLGCRRAYEFVLAVRTDTGDIVSSRRMALDVLGARAGGSWPVGVDPDGFCQVDGCQ